MIDLNTAARHLQLMRQQILPFMDALFKGAPEDVSERNRRLTELERIKKNLEILARDLRSEQHRLQALQKTLPSVPRDQRWPANQSLQQQRQNIENAQRQADGLADAVKQLMYKNGFLSRVQMGMKFGELLKNMEHSAEHGQALQQIMLELGEPSIALPPMEHSSVSSLVPVLIFIVYGIRRLTGKQDAAGAANT